MRKLLTFVVATFALALFISGSELATSTDQVSIPVPTRSGLTAHVGLGLSGRGGPFSLQREGNTLVYVNDLYQIRITESPNRTRSVLKVHVESVSGEPFLLGGFSMLIRIPRAEIDGIWSPSAPVKETMVSAEPNKLLRTVSDANFGIPYLAAASQRGGNILAMGLLRQDLAVDIEGTPVSNAFYEFRLAARTTRVAPSFDELFFVSAASSVSWFEIARNYADSVDAATGYQPFPVNDRCYEPSYDTWYWSHDDVTEDIYVETAQIASRLGFGTFIADAGWDTPTGEYDRWLDGSTGDYTPPLEKFSDLAQTFNTIRFSHKLGIQLWLPPFAVGRASERYPETHAIHIQVPKTKILPGWSGLSIEPFALPIRPETLESVNLCPRMMATHAYLQDLFTRMATEYKPEGYWLDFIDGMPSYCVAPHQHDFELFGDGLRKALETIRTTILANNPKAVVQFRAAYANLNNKAYANVWQTEDSPENFDRMRLVALRMRPFSKGVVFGSDQTYWPDSTDEATVSRFAMTAAMIGVPSFGPNLLTAPPSTLAIISAWVGFYRQFKEDLTQGRFEAIGRFRVPNHKIESGNRTFVYVRNIGSQEIPTEGAQEIYLLNASDTDRFLGKVRVAAVRDYSVKVLDRYFDVQFEGVTLRPDENRILDLDVAVDEGGIIVLKAM